MTRTLFLFLLLSLSATSYAQENNFTVTGNVKGLKDGTIVSLYIMDERNLEPYLDTEAENGHFFFEGYTAGLKKYMLLSFAEGIPSMMLHIYVAPDKHPSVQGDDLLIWNWKIESDIPEQIEYNLFREVVWDESRESQKIMLELREAEKAEKQDEIDSLATDYYRLQYLIKQKQLQLMKTLPVTEYVSSMLNEITYRIKYSSAYEDLRADVEAVFERFSPEQKKSAVGINIHENLNVSVFKNGTPMADAELFDTDGKKHLLSDYKGKYILLDFWAHWCGYCLMAVPEMKELHEKYSDTLTIVGINTDKEKDLSKWIEMSEEKGMDWINLHLPKETDRISQRYGVKGLPHYVLISPEGIILENWGGYQEGWIKERVEKHIPIEE